jgi:hypothetical protein
MKFQKLDSKQVPQAVALGVLCLAALGWGGYNLASGLSAGNAQAAPVDPAVQATGQEAPSDPGTPVEPEGTENANPEMAQSPMADPSLLGGGAGSFNPDPFRPKVKTKPQELPKPPAPVPNPGALPPVDPWASGPAGGSRPGYGPAVAAAPQPEAPPAPERPELAITGIIDVDKGPDMALVEVGAEQRIIQVGEKLPNSEYRVKRIGLDGVLLVHSGDRYFVALGNKAEAR